MTLHRFFAVGPLQDSGELPISARDVHHIRDVLRLGRGDRILIVADDAVTEVRLTGVGQTISGTRERSLGSEAVPPVLLVQGIAKGERMDTVIRQATEVGITGLIPFTSERCVVQLDASNVRRKVERWRRVAEEAAKQSQRASVPQVADPVPLSALPALLADAVVVVCWEGADSAPGIGQALSARRLTSDAIVAVVIGPEGGLSADEVAFLESHGASVVTLGSTLLRTDTAGLIASSLVLYERGALGGRRA